MLIAAHVRGQDIRLNDDGGLTDQLQPRVAATAGEGFVVAWSDYRRGQRDIYVQRLASNGMPIGTNRLVVDDATGAFQESPAIACDYAYRYSLVWQDYRGGNYPFDPRLYSQRFDSALGLLGVNAVVATGQPDTLKEHPDLAVSPGGSGVIVWADYRALNWDIYGLRIAADGTPVGTEFRVNDDNGTAQQHAPRVSVSPQGWFVVAWYDNRSGNDDVFVQLFDSTGLREGGNTRANANTNLTRQAFPDIAADGVGYFTVVWVDWRSGSYPDDPDVYARKFSRSLTPVALDRRVNSDVSRRGQWQPAIAADRMGNVGIVWADSTAGSWNIMGQMIDVDGVIREPGFQAHTGTDSAQLQPDIALDGRRRIVTWTDRRNGNHDVYASVTTYQDPRLIATPELLSFEQAAGGDLPDPISLSITHAGYNPLHFEIVETIPWLTVAPASGVTPANVSVQISQAMPFGTYSGTITLVDADYNDSSLMIPVQLTVSAPVLDISPDTISIEAVAFSSDLVTGQFTIANLGSGSLIYTITDTCSWLSCIPATGTAPEEILVVADPEALFPGSYLQPLVVRSSGAVGSPDTIWLQAEISPPDYGVDSVRFSDLILTPGVSDALVLSVSLVNPLGLLEIPFHCDSSLIRIDSVLSLTPFSPATQLGWTINQQAGRVAVTVQAGASESALPLGPEALLLVYLTGLAPGRITSIDTGSFDGFVLQFGTPYGATLVPHVDPGEIEIDSPTDLPPANGSQLPTQCALAQNYPNPFNSRTLLWYSLPRAENVDISVFNVLGQQVATLEQGAKSAGYHWVEWDGVGENGRELPSGIYFYRLRAGEVSLVRKLVFLK